ncbi:MAG: polysaccharide deacetylase, partial [Firmicutes bacterium]|nr:polysaccharide deacetylase [Bacillota bacterium]
DATSGQMILKQIGQAVPGDLILMHPKPNTAKVLEAALIGLQGKGLHPMTLSDMLSPEPESPASAYEHQHDPGL